MAMATPQDLIVMDLVALLDFNLREAFEERAGIIEFDAQVARGHAECLALLSVLRTHPHALSRFWLFQAEFQGTKRCFLTTHRQLALQPLDPAKVLDEQFNQTALLSPV
jgi:hypothetical protein